MQTMTSILTQSFFPLYKFHMSKFYVRLFIYFSISDVNIKFVSTLGVIFINDGCPLMN